MKRIDLLYKMDGLLNQCKSCERDKSGESPEVRCKGCDIYDELRGIGNQLGRVEKVEKKRVGRPKKVKEVNTLENQKERSIDEYEALKHQLAEKIKSESEKDSIISKLEAKVEELEHLHNACEDVEKESARFRKERDTYLQQLLDTRHKLHEKDYLVENQKDVIKNTRTTLESYERENKHLRALVREWA
jgi:chromosome segregation ATPase